MKTRGMCCLACSTVVALFAALPSPAQNGEQAKPPQYLYLSQWAVPRAQWPEMVKVDEQDQGLLQKLLADGTLTGYGAFTNLIHREGEPTHGTWFTASSEGNLLKTLEALYAHPGSTTAPVEAASKHWDHILVSDIYNQRPGKYDGGYLSGDQWQVKPEQMRTYTEFVKRELVPLYEKLLADGTITSYGMGTEDFHTGNIGFVTFWFTTPDTASFDTASKAFDQVSSKNPSAVAAFRSMVDLEGHRDFLDRLRYMQYK